MTETSKNYGLAINNIEGKLDPNNPVAVSGSADISEYGKLTWNLKRCQ